MFSLLSSDKEKTWKVLRLLPERQGQNQALTDLHVPYSLDSGSQVGEQQADHEHEVWSQQVANIRYGDRPVCVVAGLL